MASTPPASSRNSSKLERSARLAWLESALAGRPEADAVMVRASRLEAGLADALVRMRHADPTQRSASADELVRLRRELENLIAAACPAGATEPPASHPGAGPPAELRQRLAQLLGVPMTPPFDGVLDVKLAEHSEQLRAYHHVATEFGFMTCDALGKNEPRGVLLLTANASIVQLSAPGVDACPGARRYVYQGIYGAAVPSEGTLSLLETVRPGQPLHAIGFMTSPICELRAPSAPGPWERERTLSSTLERVFGAARDRARTAWGVQPDWIPSVVVPPEEPRDAKGLTARMQLRAALARLPANSPPDPLLEAEVLGLCMHLQELAKDAGGRAAAFGAVRSFDGVAGEHCEMREKRGRRVIALLRPGRPQLQLMDASVAAQRVVVGAPLALLDGRGTIAAVIGEVSDFRPA